MRQLFFAAAIAAVITGCGGGPLGQCVSMAGTFHAAQLGAEGAMYSDSLTKKQEGMVKTISPEGVKQQKICREAALNSDGDTVKFSTAFLAQATVQLTSTFMEAPAPALPDFGPAGGPR